MSCIRSRIRIEVGLGLLVSINIIERKDLKLSLSFSFLNLCVDNKHENYLPHLKKFNVVTSKMNLRARGATISNN